jgi:shikimate dehydrogenase
MTPDLQPLNRLAVIGHPVSHSRSPVMQNAALAELGLGETWTYEAIDVAPEGFRELISSMVAQGFVGANVTVPHKEIALEVADSAGPEAAGIGASNTLLFGPDEIRAENTDAPGLLAAIGEVPAGRALVLGAGGAGRAAIWALVSVGHQVDVWNRTPERASTVAAELGVAAVQEPSTESYGVIVNSTSVGLAGEGGVADLPLDPEAFGLEQIVVDMVYGTGPGELLEAARAKGARTVDGIEILVRQGALSLEMWTGLDAPLEVMRAAARA